MASPLRPRSIPQCTACIRGYVFGTFSEHAAIGSALRQQTRGKKRMPNNSATVTVKLRTNVKTFGRKGAIVPVPRGQMRNDWFPRGIAEYVTLPELKTLRLSKVGMERDYQYGVQDIPMPLTPADDPSARMPSAAELRSASAFQKVEVAKLTPERSKELLEIFVGPRIEFYRQPIHEEKEVEEPKAEEKKPDFAFTGFGPAAELMAARMPSPEAKKAAQKTGPTPIYGSVSALDVLQAVRATIARNDEAARVVLQEEDVAFVDLPETEHSEAGKVKHIGDFTVEVKVRGAEDVVRRIVRIIPQEA